MVAKSRFLHSVFWHFERINNISEIKQGKCQNEGKKPPIKTLQRKFRHKIQKER